MQPVHTSWPVVFKGEEITQIFKELKAGAWVSGLFKEGSDERDATLLHDLKCRGVIHLDDTSAVALSQIFGKKNEDGGVWKQYARRTFSFRVMKTMTLSERERVLRLGTKFETIELPNGRMN